MIYACVAGLRKIIVVVHGCTVDDCSLIGIKSVILNGAKIGKGCIIGAGAVVPENAVIPDYSLVVGVPGKVIKTNPAFLDRCKFNAEAYLALKDQHEGGVHKIYGDAKL